MPSITPSQTVPARCPIPNGLISVLYVAHWLPCLALVAMAAEYYRRRAAVSNQRGTPQTSLVCSVSWPRFAERSS